MMDSELRRRHISLKQSNDVVEDKKNGSPIRKISSQSLTKLEKNGSNEPVTNVPYSETLEGNFNCDFDSLVSSTCSSGDFQECTAELSDDYKIKISKIQAALRDPVDQESLRTLARSEGGLINDDLRRKVWPELLDVVNNGSIFSATDEDMKKHKEFHQVVLDVNRALKRFPPGISNSERIILQDQLTKLILNVIVKHPFLCYYQGYHDVAVTLLLVVGDEKDQHGEYSEDETEEPILGRDSTTSVDNLENGIDDSLEREKELGEKNTLSQSEMWCQGESETQREAKEKEIPPEDGIVKNEVSIGNDSSTCDLCEGSKQENKECMELETNSIATVSSSLNENGEEIKPGSDLDESNVDGGNVLDSCSDSETESVEKSARKRVISMWCSEMALNMLEHLSLHHFRGCMEPTMDATSRLLHHVFPIVAREDRLLCAFLDRSGVGTVYCLPWILTWYGHSLSNHDVVVRLYDYFLASPVTAPLYLAASIVLYRRKEILETECEMAPVHGLLSEIPDDLPFELLLSRASALYEAHPPESLQKDVEERSNREFQAREDRSSKLGSRRMSQPAFNSALIQWPLLAMLPPQYVNRFVPWFWLPRGRMQWLGAWAQMIPIRHLNRRFLLAALPIAMYGIYSHLASNSGT